MLPTNIEARYTLTNQFEGSAQKCLTSQNLSEVEQTFEDQLPNICGHQKRHKNLTENEDPTIFQVDQQIFAPNNNSFHLAIIICE